MKLWENLYVPGHLFTIFKLNSLVKDSFQTLIKQKTSLSSFLYNVYNEKGKFYLIILTPFTNLVLFLKFKKLLKFTQTRIKLISNRTYKNTNFKVQNWTGM